MRMRLLLGTATVALALAFGTAPIVAAGSDGSLTAKEARKLLKKSEKALKKAEKAARRGDGATVAAQAQAHADAQARINAGLAQAEIEQENRIDVAARVDEATFKHIPVLEGLLETVPEQARGAIERALIESRTGHDVATQAILAEGQVDLSGRFLNDREARVAMAKNEALVRMAERARQRGDNARARQAAEVFAANSAQVAAAIERNQVDPYDAPTVFDRVSRETSRHFDVLSGLLDTVPEEARPAIERAMAASQRGHVAATAAISRTPAAGIATGRPGVTGAPSGVGTGRPSGIPGGPPSGTPGGPPSGAGRPPR